MRKAIIFLVVAFVIVIGIGAVFLQLRGGPGGGANANAVDRAKVDRGDLVIKVVETGILDAVRSVDVRTRASGRLKELKVKEGDIVKAGDLIAIIDPLETELRVKQDTAQMSGARAGVARTGIEIEQRRVTAKAALDQAEARMKQVRMELDTQPTLTRSSIIQAEAALASAQENLTRLQTSAHPTQLTAADTEVKNARVDRDTAEREFNRISDLLARGYVAQSALDSARLRVEQSRNRLEKAVTDRQRLDVQQRSELASAQQDLKSAAAALSRAKANGIQDQTKKEEYASAVAAVNQAKAALRDVEVLRQSLAQGRATVAQLQSVLADSQRQLRETEVRAPMDGIVSKKYIEIGDMVTGLSLFSQGTAIVRVEDRSALRVKLDINEIDVARLQIGMEATVAIDAFPDKIYEGKISKIAPASNALQASASMAASAAVTSEAVVKYQVEILLDESDPRLRSGMSAKCTFETLNVPNVLRAPLEFVGKDAEGDFVLIAPAKGSKDKPKRVAVTLGAKTGAFVEIKSGVKQGDELALPEYKGPKRKGFFQAGPDDEQPEEDQGKGKEGGAPEGGKGK